MVSRDSAIFATQTEERYDQLSRDVDHSGLAKFDGRAEQDYINLRGKIRECIEEAPRVIEGRFAVVAGSNATRVLLNAVQSVNANTEAVGKHARDCPYELPFHIDYFQNTNFTGRDAVLQNLDVEIRLPSSRVIILCGMGGIGKTQIALQYVHTHYAEYNSVFWVDGTSEETASQGFRSIAQQLINHHANMAGYTSPDYPQILRVLGINSTVDGNGQLCIDKEATVRVVDAVKRWYGRKENQNWLLVLDNVDDLTSFDIRSFIPTTSHGKTLITSRRRECMSLGRSLNIGEMLEAEAINLLLSGTKSNYGQHTAAGKSRS